MPSPASDSHSLESTSATASEAIKALPSTESQSPEASNVADAELAEKRILTLLVQNAFRYQQEGHADLYHQTRFFTARMQARMRYIAAQPDSEGDAPSSMAPTNTGGLTGGVENDTTLELAQAEVDQLNSIMTEMLLASRKLYQSWGCLSYDLTLCSGQIATGGPKLTSSQKAAMAKWEKRLSTPFVARKRLAKGEAEEIHSLVQGIQSVLLA
ncbi:hypothetical protein GGI04_002355 [Coemansia thaxteri]|uniref:Uncharacterized protein n=1 Tax=Coemansia thaxteri TaxID=2663907 RepID=A0A9W8EIM8_9FUNG|nr:hypothetical protein H4R26_002237 [Coemansia thaxteri]KAJ2005157.1 hypothetical protein GGI04_002355 [Coemansia thaxteri]KAJ2469054.1 hypothetical protein EV174_006249 [Coemansia sp. RSA 2320]